MSVEWAIQHAAHVANQAKLAIRQEEVNIQFELDRTARLAAEAAEATKKGKKARSRKEKEEEEAARLAAEKAGTAPKLTLDDVSDDEEPEEEKEVPMYFKTPQQLLDIFTALEESNLFLIQNSQETEAALEELRTKFAETRTHMEAESDSLKVQIDHLKSGIAVERDHSAVLAERAGRRACLCQSLLRAAGAGRRLAIGEIDDPDRKPLGGQQRQRAAAADLHVVGMGPDGDHVESGVCGDPRGGRIHDRVTSPVASRRKDPALGLCGRDQEYRV